MVTFKGVKATTTPAPHHSRVRTNPYRALASPPPMRRREVLGALSVAALPPLAGCGPCGETWTGVGFRVDPTDLTSQGGNRWTVRADLEVVFGFGRDGTGVFGAALAAFDDGARVVGSTSLGDLTWEDVPAADRTAGECGSHGTYRETATVEADGFPRWVGLRYDDASRYYTEDREVARFQGDPGGDGGESGGGSPGGPAADRYEQVAVDALDPRAERPTVTPPVEAVAFRPGPPVCEPPAEPSVDRSLAGTTLVQVEHARSVPGARYAPTLAAYAFGDVVRLDVGLRPRPRLRRTDCLSVAYEASATYDARELETEPDGVELRHLDAGGAVRETATVPFESGEAG